MSNDVMIYANDLSKSFGSFRALDKINFEVKRGEIVGFLGPNGAGKSTTMRILTCFISPTGGTARVNGHDVFDEPLQVLALRRIDHPERLAAVDVPRGGDCSDNCSDGSDQRRDLWLVSCAERAKCYPD